MSTIANLILQKLRMGDPSDSLCQFAVESTVAAVKADRGLIWRIVDEQLVVAAEAPAEQAPLFSGIRLSPQESTAFVLFALALFPDDAGSDVATIPDVSADSETKNNLPTVASLLQSAKVRSRSIIQLRNSGRFIGLLELQHCRTRNAWSKKERELLQSAADAISAVVKQAYDLERMTSHIEDMQFVAGIAKFLQRSESASDNNPVLQSVLDTAAHLGFEHCQLYLADQATGILVAKLRNGDDTGIKLSETSNPFIKVFKSGRATFVNIEGVGNDPVFAHETAVLFPLQHEGKNLGVVGFWKQPIGGFFKLQDRDLVTTIVDFLASTVHFQKLAKI